MPTLANALIACVLAVAALPTAALAAGAATAPAVAAESKAMQPTPAKPNGNGIEVRYRLEAVPQAGQPLQVSLAFSSPHPGGEPTAWFTLTGGLAWAAEAPAVLALSDGAPTRQQVTVLPPADGIGYLNVFTRQDGIDSVTAIPVRVGKAAPSLRQPGAVKTSPGGDRVISLPVP